MAHLNALDLLSPQPYPIARVGHVIAPTLRQVAALGYETYNAYLSLLSLHAEQLFAASGLPIPVRPTRSIRLSGIRSYARFYALPFPFSCWKKPCFQRRIAPSSAWRTGSR